MPDQVDRIDTTGMVSVRRSHLLSLCERRSEPALIRR